MTPDNNIKFVDNGAMIRNPKPTKTPPPPLWGEESEVEEKAGEPFFEFKSDPARKSATLAHLDSSRSRRQTYIKNKLSEQGVEDDTTETVIIQDKRPKGSKLKKKIVYVYDSDSEEEGQGGRQVGYSKPPKAPGSIRSSYQNSNLNSRQYIRKPSLSPLSI